MTKAEKFNLTAGIIGLLADAIGLATFLAGVWGPRASPANVPAVFKVLSAFLILYSWVMISWVFARRSIPDKRLSSGAYWGNVWRAVAGVGILVLPIVIAWWVATVTPPLTTFAGETVPRPDTSIFVFGIPFVHGLVICLISAALGMLLRVVYPRIEVYIEDHRRRQA